MPFYKVFLGQVKDLAKQIAYHQRCARELQGVPTLIAKYERELQELQETSTPEEEIPDIVYYAVQLWWQGKPVYLSQAEQIVKQYGLSIQQAQWITLAKYTIRAEGRNSKDFERERAEIRRILG